MLDQFDALRGAEFPHDNPELFSGPGWLAVEPCGGPRAIAWASRRDLHYGAPNGDVALPAAPPEPVAPAELTDFDRLLVAVRAVVPDLGMAAELERFLRTGESSAEVLALASTQALVASGWRRLLSGVESDLAACGDRPLDEWVAGLVGACLGYDASATAGLRRALRKRGVAAFGMLGG